MSVYFATCREANAVKIGSSLEPYGRLPELQRGCPLLLTIEAILPGGTEEEFTFHRRFVDARIHGEWFKITEMIEMIIAANPAPQQSTKLVRKPRDWAPKAPKAAKPAPLTYEQRAIRKQYIKAMVEMQVHRELTAIQKEMPA